ncbi:MAG: TonB-dependent receptor [Bryobacteraceae bacterium]|nr:TonB-dependent receptor [Bryobacteraceae bacterium]
MNALSRLTIMCSFCVTAAYAQDFRANIVGLVVDPSKAPIAGAEVTAIQDSTNASRSTITNTEGMYTLVGLEPGRYTVTITAPGFAAMQRSGIVLQTAQRLNLPIVMQLGQVSESVTVIGQQELIESATASRGQVFDEVKMAELPIAGRTVFMLMTLSNGVMWTRRSFGPTGFSAHSAWAMDSLFTMNGGRTGTNQFLLNGAPISTEGTFNVLPNVDAVEEMKVMVNTYDSQYGRSGGGHVSTTLRSGTNAWHGSVVNFWRNRVLDANYRQNNAGGQPRGFRNQHQFSGVIGGPIRKDRDFIFGSMEGWRSRLPFPIVSTVPNAEVRTGNFNFTPKGQSGPIRVYDQLTSVPCTTPGVSCTSGGLYLRQPFPGNVIPASRISAVGRAIINLYPTPNFDPTSLTQNFLRSDNTGRYRYEQPMARWDHIFENNDRFSFVFQFFDGTEFRNSNGFDPPAQNGNMMSWRRNYTYIASLDKTFTPTMIMRVQASYNRFIQNFPNVSDPEYTWDKLGIKNIPLVPTYPTKAPPAVSVGGYTGMLGSTFLNESSRQQLNFQASVSQTTRRHGLKYGFEWAQMLHHSRPSGNASGNWAFGDNWSRQHFGRRLSTPLDGNGAADLLLGYMNSGNIPYNDSNLRREPYIAVFLQDDWKVSPRLTLNLGLRYDIQFPMYEINDRLVAGLDFESPNPVSDQVLANWRQYAATTANYPRVPDAIRGGLMYAGVGGQSRRIYNFDLGNIQPRVGFAFSFLPKTVMRGGFGIFHRTLLGSVVSNGFSQNTDYINSVNGGLTHRASATGPYSLENPFSDGLIEPIGSSGGLLTSLGASVTANGRQRPMPRTFQWSYTLERELGWNMVVEASYVGSLTNKEPMSIQLSDASREDYELAIANPTYFQQTVRNPWFGILPTNTALGAADMITRQNLLRRIPQFTGVTMTTNPWGRTWYHGLQTRFEKRLMGERSRTGALTWVLNYTWSKMLEKSLRQAQTFEWMPLINQVTAYDRTHSMTLASVWDLPFGRNRAMLANMNGVGQAILGNWTLSTSLTYESGVPLNSWTAWEYLCGNPLSGDRSENRWFDNTLSCYRQLTPFQYTQLEARSPHIRSHFAPQLDVTVNKTFKYKEKVSVEVRGEAFNATNTPLRQDPPSTNPSAADFGRLPVQQLNFPRGVQLSIRVRF